MVPNGDQQDNGMVLLLIVEDAKIISCRDRPHPFFITFQHMIAKLWMKRFLRKYRKCRIYRLAISVA